MIEYPCDTRDDAVCCAGTRFAKFQTNKVIFVVDQPNVSHVFLCMLITSILDVRHSLEDLNFKYRRLNTDRWNIRIRRNTQ